ncbi:hypothetical protein Ancab_019411 [Ancistrocladus abbreviatus]
MRKGKPKNNRLLPSSLRIISSCLKTVSSNATTVASTVRSAGASVAASITAASDDHRDQVTWVGCDKLELGSSICRHVLLLGYQNGFQALDVEDASSFSELVSKRDGTAVTFLQMQPIPLNSGNKEGFRKSHPLLLVVAGDDTHSSDLMQNQSDLGKMGTDRQVDPHARNYVNSPTAVRFYSLRSHSYVHVLRFRSAVCMVRCSPRVVAVGLATQIYCFDALTLENKFSVLTYPLPQVGGQGGVGVNIGYGPMAVGPRWLAYASNHPFLVTKGRLNPQNFCSPGASQSASPASGSLMARYALESGKQLASGIVNLGDRGYKSISKYCQDLLPDNSNSLQLASSGSRVSNLPASAEASNAGVVVVKDTVSRAVISQFKAHSSPISALCFDPSGTLLVTASVHGNSINIFRIMPSCAHTGSETQNDWSTTYAHLYKLHRGIRAAIIEDICFSHYSQWIAIVSSKGTCHVFVLSPFGGDVGFQSLNSQGEEASLSPVLTIPWWSQSTSITSHLSTPPPPPPPPPPTVSLSVVSRIRDINSGLLTTVTNAAASVSGKVSPPSGAFVAVFHNSMRCRPHNSAPAIKSMEHLLVYTPSGHVVQHEIQPAFGPEQSDGGSRTHSGSFMQMQEAKFSVNIQPVQWWDVCRRSDWPEKEECISDMVLHAREATSFVATDSNYGVHGTRVLETKDYDGRGHLIRTDSLRPNENSNWYLSNAEVQYSSGRIPIWQRSQISFHVMGPPRCYGHVSGEFQIEKVPASEVEVRRKDLLPVFDHFHGIKSAWSERDLTVERYPVSFTLETHYTKDKATEETIICHSKPASLSSTESSDGGSSRRLENLPDFDHLNFEVPYGPIHHTKLEHCHERRESASELSTPSKNLTAAESFPPGESKAKYCVKPTCLATEFSELESESLAIGRGISESYSDNLGPSIGDTYCKTSVSGVCSNPAEDSGLTVANSPVNCENGNLNEEEEDMLGDLFAFSEG